MKSVFTGSGVALVTPFGKDGKIDFDLFSKLIEFQKVNNTDAIIVCGTTGEGSTLTVDERLELFSLAAEKIKGDLPLIGGTGSNSTSFSLSLAKEAEKCGVDAHLMVTPYYNKTSQTGLIKHYFHLADNLEKPVIVYNVPSRTGMNITPETYKKLSEHENIVAVKEADTNIVKLEKSIYLCEGNLDFYVGNDDMISSGTAVGCKGVISVLANIVPYYTHILASCGANGNRIDCLKMQNKVLNLVEMLFCDVNPIPVKQAMEYLNLSPSFCRLPLCELSKENKIKLHNTLVSYKDIIEKEIFL